MCEEEGKVSLASGDAAEGTGYLECSRHAKGMEDVRVHVFGGFFYLDIHVLVRWL